MRRIGTKHAIHYLMFTLTKKIKVMKKLKIWYDQSPMNPFVDWDCEPSLMFNSRDGRTDYSEGSILTFIQGKATDGYIIRHQRKIVDIIGNNLEYYEGMDKEDKAEAIRDDFSEANIEQLGMLCDFMKIPNKQYTSRGYSQGDWAEVLIVLDDEFFQRTGAPKDHNETNLNGAAKLFDSYAWGDVYGFTVVELTDCECCGTTNEEAIESCGGFYGDDFETNGMLDELPEELHEQLKNFDHSQIEY